MEIKTGISLSNLDLNINQIGAASDVYKALNEITKIKTDPTLTALAETDIYRLRRGLCLPCAAATCINNLLGEKKITEKKDDSDITNSSHITIGDFYRILIPFHNKRGLIDDKGNIYPNPWYVVNSAGDVYHQAIIAFSRGLGIEALSLINFSNVEVFIPLISQGDKLAISLDNRFVLEKTLGLHDDFVIKKPDGYYIKIEGPDGLAFRKFEEGRHVVAIIGLNPDKKLIIHDSFLLPQMAKDSIMVVEPDIVNSYLKEPSRGIIFFKPKEITGFLRSFINTNVFVPREISDIVRQLLLNKIIPNIK